MPTSPRFFHSYMRNAEGGVPYKSYFFVIDGRAELVPTIMNYALISLAPVNHILSRLAAAYALVADLLLLEWDTS